MTALNATTVNELAGQGTEPVEVPDYNLDERRIGIVHFGVGGFHRAHQAVYLDQLFNSGHDPDWAVCGVGLMPGDERMRDVLTAQDGLYTLVTKAPNGSREPRIIGAIAEHLLASDDPEAVLEKMTDPAVRIVSLTVTEGGYNYNPTTGEFLADTPEVAQDLAENFSLNDTSGPKTMFGFVVEALRRRRQSGTEPFTVLSCDNVRGNGDLAKRMVLAYCRLKDTDLADWLESHVAFPNCMVDRITPVTTDDDRAMVAQDFGIDDAWPVVSEDFLQWMLEDNFPTGRPAFDDVGVQLVDDVEPYELMKLRLLNCGHQAIAYFGLLLGYTYAHEAAMDDDLNILTRRRYMDDEATPTVPDVPGIDLDEYKDELLSRFSNPHIADTLARLSAESSDRIPTWMVPIIHENLAAGRDVTASAAIVASWARYAEGVGENGEEWPVEDRLQHRVMAAAARHEDDILAFIRDEELFGDLAEKEEFTQPYRHALQILRTHGARALLKELTPRA